MTQTGRKKLKILVFAHYYPPEMGGAAARVHGLARWLVSYGHRVTVITGFPNYPTGVIPGHCRGRMRAREVQDGVEVIRTWVYATSHQRDFGRLSNYFTFVLSSIATSFLLKTRYDVILASSPPLFIGLSGLFLSRLRRIPFVFDIRDIWPDVAVDTGAFKPDSLWVLLGRKLARLLYEKADHITPVTERKLEKIVTAGIGRHKVTVVPNGVDLDRLDTTKTDEWRVKLGLKSRFLAVYTGLIGIAQGVGIIVEAANYLREDQGIHFLIVGDGVEREQLMSRAHELGLTNVTFVPSQPRRVIPSIVALADISLVPLVSAELSDAVPSKLMEAWGCRKPVLLAADGEAASIVREGRGGIVVPPRDSSRLAKTIRRLSQDRETLGRYGENGYAFVQAHFDRSDLARMMETVLVRISERRIR